MKKLIYFILLTLISGSAMAESLFQANASESVYKIQPKSLFSTVRAKTIGDVITVVVNENALVLNDLQLNIKSDSSMEDNFTSTINDIFTKSKYKTKLDLPNVDGFGGGNQTKNTANVQKSLKIQDTITAQVVQVLPNGNLVIQGKKVAINSGEKTQIILSGIVDPRFITNTGTIQSQYIANLQLAMVGNGTVSRHDGESVLTRIFTHLF